MNFTIVEESINQLQTHGEIPIWFEAQSIFEIEGDDPETATLIEKRLAHPLIKDYDVAAGEGPIRWSERWDIPNWGLLAAYANGKQVGGCVLAFDTSGVHKLEERDDMVALWIFAFILIIVGWGLGVSCLRGRSRGLKHDTVMS